MCVFCVACVVNFKSILLRFERASGRHGDDGTITKEYLTLPAIPEAVWTRWKLAYKGRRSGEGVYVCVCVMKYLSDYV